MTKRKRAKISQMKSFAVAFQGIWTLIYNERNFRFHLAVSIAVIIACFFFNVEKTEWFAVLLSIGLVLSMEALNTSVEYICDLISPEHHPMVKMIKDVGAAAVLLAAIVSIITGCIIFIPHILNFFNIFIFQS